MRYRSGRRCRRAVGRAIEGAVGGLDKASERRITIGDGVQQSEVACRIHPKDAATHAGRAVEKAVAPLA